MRPILALIAAITLLSPLSALAAQTASQDTAKSSPSAPAASVAPLGKDAPAPEPTAALKALLAPLAKQLADKQYASALSGADVALQAAQQGQDRVGEAMALRVRALALEGLGKSEEAIAAWKQAAVVWGGVGDGPGQVEALVNASLLLTRGHAEEAKQLLAQAISLTQAETKRPLQAALTLNDSASRAYAKGQLDAVQTLSKATLAFFDKFSPDSLDVARSLGNLGIVAYRQRDFAAAETYHKQALAIRQKLAPGSALVGNSLSNLGNVALERRDLGVAEEYYKQALAIRTKLSPDSSTVADTLNNLGNVHFYRSDLAEAAKYYEQALVIREKLDPGSLDVAASLNNLGAIALGRGDFPAAESYFKRALEIKERLDPGSLDVASSLNNLGNVATYQGDLVTAEDYYKRALTIKEQQEPGTPDLASTLSNLGSVAYSRNDLSAAESDYVRALKILEERVPGSLDVSKVLYNLGIVTAERGSFAVAEAYHKKALAIQEKQAPGSLDAALTLDGLGIVAYDRGGFAAAENFHKQALAIEVKQAPGSQYVAESLNNLGLVAQKRGDLVAAEGYYNSALPIWEKLSPGSLNTASNLTALGTALVNQHHPEQAIPFFTRAIAIVEAQRGKVAGADARTLLIQAHTDVYAALLDAYISLHQDANAFNTLERQRGRSLAESLFEHQHITSSNQVPQTLLARQNQLDNQHDFLLTQRQRLNPSDPKDTPRYAQNDAALQQLNVQQRQLEAQIRHVSPHYANLHYPTPLDLKTVQQTLDPGTLLLEYALNAHQTYLFAVTNHSFHRYTLPLERKDLQASIKALTDSLTDERAPRHPAVAVQLYNRLLRPAQVEIEHSVRLLLCPEQELWRIPFCALIDNNNAAAPHYLVESKPLHSVVSMNVYAQIVTNRNRPHAAYRPLLAFGDPAYRVTAALSSSPSRVATEGSVRAPVALAQATVPGAEGPLTAPATGTLSPSPLATSPTTRLLLGGHSFARVSVTGTQVRALVALFGKEAVVHLGKEATPSRVFQEAGSARILHFACHGFLDDRDPLASFLALTPERTGEDFGMVAAYEVLERLHLNADLVTLGACETGAGEQSSTEGVIGLTRAFEYAGARSVLVSLWEIDANSASLLLSGTEGVAADKQASKVAISQSFYGALRLGLSKDVALRIAQMALIGGKRVAYRDPRNWAAFSLQGDWR